MFATRSGKLYIDDLVVKSEKMEDHLMHLAQTFDILRQYKMKFNPKKCNFGLESQNFLGHMVTRRGIEANPTKIKAILDMSVHRSIKEVQKWTGRLAALNRFISHMGDKCKPFFCCHKKGKV